MRFLVVSALFACAAAAPSHLLAPVAVAGVRAVPVAGLPAVPVAFPAAIPTLSPGDVQAAAIDAQVKAIDAQVQAQDLAIAAADKARELTEQATDNLNDKAIVGSDLVKASNEENFWAVQDKQWQALDALKTAEARLDGAIASNAPIIAKNAVAGQYIAAVAPISPVVFAPGIVAPVLKSAEPSAESPAESPAVSPAEPAKEEKAEEKPEALVKSAEENKEEKESVTIEAAKENLEAKSQLAPLVTPLAITPYGYPIVAPVALSAVPYGAFPHVGLVPTIVKGW